MAAITQVRILVTAIFLFFLRGLIVITAAISINRLFFSFFLADDVPLVEFMYLVFTRMPGESYRRWFCCSVCV